MRNILNTVTTGFRSLRGSIGRGDSGSGSGSWGLGMKLPNLMLGSTGPKDGSGGKFNWLRCATTQLNKPRNLQLASICARTSNQAGKGDEFILHDEKASFFSQTWMKRSHEGCLMLMTSVFCTRINMKSRKWHALNLVKKFCQPRIEESSESHPFAEIEAKLDHISEQVPWRTCWIKILRRWNLMGLTEMNCFKGGLMLGLLVRKAGNLSPEGGYNIVNLYHIYLFVLLLWRGIDSDWHIFL